MCPRQEARLRQRLAKLRLEMDVMAGDGSCLFRSVANDLWGSPRFHGSVRRKAVKWMRCAGAMACAAVAPVCNAVQCLCCSCAVPAGAQP